MWLKKLPQLLWAKRRENKPDIKQKTIATIKTQTNAAKWSYCRILLAWYTIPKWMQNSPKQKHMQQSNPIFLFAWLTLPKWMENNPKPKQMQQRSPKMETIQSQNKCSKVILMQWQWLFTLLNLLDCLFRLSVEKVWYASFLFLYVSSECCTWTDALRSMWFAVVCSRVRFKTCKRNSTH